MDNEAKEYLSGLTDDELKAQMAAARDDLNKAAENHPDSEWHQACFAGALMLAGEMQKRGLNLATTVH